MLKMICPNCGAVAHVDSLADSEGVLFCDNGSCPDNCLMYYESTLDFNGEPSGVYKIFGNAENVIMASSPYNDSVFLWIRKNCQWVNYANIYKNINNYYVVYESGKRRLVKDARECSRNNTMLQMWNSAMQISEEGDGVV